MEPRHPDTVTPPPHLLHNQTRDNPVVALSRADIETIVDQRVAEHLRQIDEGRRRAVQEVRKAKSVTMGIGSAVGLGIGIGGTLLIQRMRRGPK